MASLRRIGPWLILTGAFASPGTFDAARLAEYLSIGINRVNLGVQSFDAAMLKACGRAHTVEDVHSALTAVRASGVRTWGMDLISGLPILTPSLWANTLVAAVAAGPHHVSVYDLQVEAGTAFGRWYVPGEAPLPTEDQSASMYVAAHEALTGAGYEHYEISNYAMPGHRCRHNLAYWQDASWHAFGVAAASHVDGRRFTRPRRMADYLAWVAAGCSQGADGTATEAADEHERLLDCLMLGMRLADGVRLDTLHSRFGDAAAARVLAAFQPAVSQGLVVWDGVSVRLAAPSGFLLSTSVLADVFARLSPGRGGQKASPS
jgi:oxygen-independent coproporphyrinogen-3 oxidase